MATVTVLQWQRAVRLHDGVLAGELGPGRHSLRRRETVTLVDVRARALVLAAQDVPTADGVLVRASVVLRWRVTDATRFTCEVAEPETELHLAAQTALRVAVAARPHTELDTRRAEIADELTAALARATPRLGIEVLAASLRDVVLPAELRRAALAELVAASEGRAALERARGETAAMRSLLNAARLAEEHPALLQLRTLQAASNAATVILDRPR
ncbi:MAG TPA: slipin family protein [Pseudonocardiaceae bacterium]